ncbi:hypothetical protein LguiA_020785 [Lonicera macranthoides]
MMKRVGFLNWVGREDWSSEVDGFSLRGLWFCCLLGRASVYISFTLENDSLFWTVHIEQCCLAVSFQF